MTSNYSQTVRTSFYPDQNHPKTPKMSKSSKIGSRRLPGVHHRQTAHTKTQKLGVGSCVAWWPIRAARQFLADI